MKPATSNMRFEGGIFLRLFDMHCDTLYECFQKRDGLKENRHHVDLRRGLRFDAWAQVFAVWLPDTLGGEAALDTCCALLDYGHRQIEANADAMRLIQKGGDLEETPAAPVCQAIFSVEGGAMLAGRLESIEKLRDRDVKIITLTWNGSNELGHGCASGCEEGLTAFGKEAVRRMESAGILPDVSHLNERGFWDVAQTAKGPFIASHSVSASIYQHARNLKDEQFAAIRQAGGLVGLNVCASQLGAQTFEQLERHFYHYLSLGGERVVAFGCDFDGTDVPEDWQGVAVMERLYAYFLQKGYAEDCLERLFYRNAFEFFRNALTSGGKID